MTAVEWLYDQIKNGFNYNRLERNGYENQRDRLFEQAKEMEKEQKIEFAKNCLHENDCFFVVEQYYNETFK